MQWYFAMSEASIDREQHGWRDLIRVSVDSALRNTTLEPHMIYDGEENAFVEEMRARGVKIVPWRVSFHDALARRGKGYQDIASGAFLRVEIPDIETEDEVVLYTDCDVVFRSDPVFDFVPGLFAGAPQTSVHDYAGDLNTGVMLLNVPALRADLPAFRAFILENLEAGWPGCDQENYRRFYKGRWQSLDPKFNWKPYWGSNKDAVIVHWHGPKPMLVDQFIRDPRLATDKAWTEMYRGAKTYYAEALREWNAVAGVEAEPVHEVWVDQASNSRIRGWSVDRRNPWRTAFLRFLVDGVPVWEGECVGNRPDVKAAGYHLATVGFDFPLAENPNKSEPGILTVENRQGVREVFFNSGRNLDQMALD